MTTATKTIFLPRDHDLDPTIKVEWEIDSERHELVDVRLYAAGRRQIVDKIGRLKMSLEPDFQRDVLLVLLVGPPEGMVTRAIFDVVCSMRGATTWLATVEAALRDMASGDDPLVVFDTHALPRPVWRIIHPAFVSDC